MSMGGMKGTGPRVKMAGIEADIRLLPHVPLLFTLNPYTLPSSLDCFEYTSWRLLSFFIYTKTSIMRLAV